MPKLRGELFKPGDRPHYYSAIAEPDGIRSVILSHFEFIAFQGEAERLVAGWIQDHRAALLELDTGSNPRALIQELSEDLLHRYKETPLLDSYAVYQRLMDYWSNEMQDDVFLVSSEGWQEAAKPRLAIDDKERKVKERELYTWVDGTQAG